MARPQSDVMKQVQAAVTNPKKRERMTPSEAALHFGILVNSIYARQWWKDWSAKQAAKEQGNG